MVAQLVLLHLLQHQDPLFDYHTWSTTHKIRQTNLFVIWNCFHYKFVLVTTFFVRWYSYIFTFFRKTAGARRLVEAHYGRIDPDEWESLPDAPICLEDALKVSLHLLAAHVHISRVFLMVVKLPQVCKNLYSDFKHPPSSKNISN